MKPVWLVIGVNDLEAPPGDLIARARLGDAGAFAQIVRRYERTALAIAYAVVGESNAAGDVVQDAFLRAWQRIGELQDSERFGGWLGTIVRNLANDHLRKRPREQGSHETVMRLIPAPPPAGGSEHGAEINAALATLDDLTRAAVVLKYYQDLSSKEIADVLGLSPPAVDMRLSRARQQLRAVLSPDSVRVT